MSLAILRQHGRYFRASAPRRGYAEPASCGFHTMLHAGETVAARRHVIRRESLAVVTYINTDVAIQVRQADFNLAGLGVFANVGERLLHETVHRQLCGAVELDRLKVRRDRQARSILKLARQNFQRCHQTQV